MMFFTWLCLVIVNIRIAMGTFETATTASSTSANMLQLKNINELWASLANMVWPRNFEFECPPAFYCPISNELMDDPVTTQYNHTFDRKSLDKWITKLEYYIRVNITNSISGKTEVERYPIDPLNRQPITQPCVENRTLKVQIDKCKRENFEKYCHQDSEWIAKYADQFASEINVFELAFFKISRRIDFCLDIVDIHLGIESYYRFAEIAKRMLTFKKSSTGQRLGTRQRLGSMLYNIYRKLCALGEHQACAKMDEVRLETFKNDDTAKNAGTVRILCQRIVAYMWYIIEALALSVLELRSTAN